MVTLHSEPVDLHSRGAALQFPRRPTLGAAGVIGCLDGGVGIHLRLALARRAAGALLARRGGGAKPGKLSAELDDGIHSRS